MKMLKRVWRRLLGANVVGLIVFLLLLMQYGLSWTTVIDTRQGGAQANQSYVYQLNNPPNPAILSPYTMSNGQAFYGNIEFRAGIQSNNASSLCIILGTSAPLNYTINVPATGSQLWVDLKNDLWLKFMDFTTAATGPAVIGFQWGAVDGDTTPYNIFLTRDVTVHPNVWLDLVSYTGQGCLDGRGNTLILMDGSRFVPESKSTTTNVLVKNIIIQGAQHITATTGEHGTSYFQDVSLYTSGTGSSNYSTLHLNHRNLVYTGLNNVLGGGGIIDFLQATTGYMQVKTGSNVYVSPQTLLKLGNTAAVAASTFLFDDATATLFLDNCTLGIGGCLNDHITFTAGTVYINGNVTLQANFAGSYLQLGDGISASHDCNIVVLPGSKLILDDGAKLVNYNV
jgi:hypothetical protein